MRNGWCTAPWQAPKEALAQRNLGSDENAEEELEHSEERLLSWEFIFYYLVRIRFLSCVSVRLMEVPGSPLAEGLCSA